MFLIHKLLDRSLAQPKNNGCRVHDGKAIFVISSALDFFFLSHRRMISSWIQQQASSQFITLACTNPLKKALKYRHVVLQCFFPRPPNRTPILNRVFYFLPSSTDSGLLALCCSLLLSRLASTPGSSASDRLHRNHQLEWQKKKKVCVCVRVTDRGSSWQQHDPQNRADGQDGTEFDSPSKPRHFQVSIHFVLFNLLAHPTPPAIKQKKGEKKTSVGSPTEGPCLKRTRFPNLVLLLPPRVQTSDGNISLAYPGWCFNFVQLVLLWNICGLANQCQYVPVLQGLVASSHFLCAALTVILSCFFTFLLACSY